MSVKDEVRQHEEVIREKQQFYENEIDNNKELEHKIAFSERTAAKLRSDYQGLETERDQFSSEVRLSDVIFVLRVSRLAYSCKKCVQFHQVSVHVYFSLSV